MAAPRRKPEKSTVPVQVMMTPQEKAEAQAKATAAGMNLSELIRTAIETHQPERPHHD